ncbi:hypothetical protein MIB92_12210 [Aestuariirhabdus sp. Z084]|uniref:hypothetical protein n=1 Tax=Aestuariirhabdus haliotis TaxID=2918751 RepID=UPI00201B413D|nr:hypothetical protein [Aestuariirhabdus haliotis]MCL6416417.1 hypothetical protein [Aestuariirhabdus haliotis]MCL6420417.1 hypothetical protein [Aestuariirhabdus haliotis]
MILRIISRSSIPVARDAQTIPTAGDTACELNTAGWRIARADARLSNSLLSSNEGKAKQSIIEFVIKVTEVGSGDYVPVEERIAVFDNDGTLWVEQPLYVHHTDAQGEWR